MNEERTVGCLGRLAPHPEETHPRLSLENHVNFAEVPAPPSSIDWCSKVSNWPMYGNDQLGDCTCAAVGHEIQAYTAYANTESDVSDDDVLNLYEAMGYVPGDPSTDNGAVIQDVLQYMVDSGCGGHKYKLFAQLKNLKDMTKVYQALDLFGSVYLGINVPGSAMDQFQNGETWSYVPGASIEGGHAIILQKKNTDGTLDIITWGAVQPMDQSFWDHYVEEAWVVVTEDWFSQKSQETPSGLNLSSLEADFKAIQG